MSRFFQAFGATFRYSHASGTYWSVSDVFCSGRLGRLGLSRLVGLSSSPPSFLFLFSGLENVPKYLNSRSNAENISFL